MTSEQLNLPLKVYSAIPLFSNDARRQQQQNAERTKGRPGSRAGKYFPTVADRAKRPTEAGGQKMKTYFAGREREGNAVNGIRQHK